MGQASKGFPRKSSGGELRCRGDGLYKEMARGGATLWPGPP